MNIFCSIKLRNCIFSTTFCFSFLFSILQSHLAPSFSKVKYLKSQKVQTNKHIHTYQHRLNFTHYLNQRGRSRGLDGIIKSSAEMLKIIKLSSKNFSIIFHNNKNTRKTYEQNFPSKHKRRKKLFIFMLYVIFIIFLTPFSFFFFIILFN